MQFPGGAGGRAEGASAEGPGCAENSSGNLLTGEPSQPAPGHKHSVQGLTKIFDPLFPNTTEIKG